MSGAEKYPTVAIENLKISRHADDLRISFDFSPKNLNPGRDREVRITPVLRSASGADSLVLSPVTVAGRNRYLLAQRYGAAAELADTYSSSDKSRIYYKKDVSYLPWMEECSLYLRKELANCCDPIADFGNDLIAKIDYRKPSFKIAPKYVFLTGDSAVEMEAEGKAFVDFIVNRTEIRPDYRRNTRELGKILASINSIKKDPDAIITRVTFKGYASPEGSYENNVRLAMGRTNALKEYVRNKLSFSSEIMHSDYEPEDWEGLRRWVLECNLPHKNEILTIIDSDLAPDPKDNEIKRSFPQEYKLILDSVYPALRHSDYTVKYQIRTFVDIDELKRVYASTPERLRPVDFQLIANTFPQGSKEFDEVLMKAVEIHPYNHEANVNAANISIKGGEMKSAAKYLAHAGESAEAIYTRAQLAALQGDLVRCKQLLEVSAKLGFEPAERELENLNMLLERQQITIMK